jgi:hypothetical protein
MRRYVILKSPANEIILSALGLWYEVTPNAIIFEGDVERDLWRLASMLHSLGYARSEADAISLAKSFFINPL